MYETLTLLRDISLTVTWLNMGPLFYDRGHVTESQVLWAEPLFANFAKGSKLDKGFKPLPFIYSFTHSLTHLFIYLVVCPR
jgi:hypothetical protein